MKNNNLEELVRTETELAEELLGLLKQQQNAIVHFKDSSLNKLVEQQQRLLRPLEELEKERIRIMANRNADDEEAAAGCKKQLADLVRQILVVNQQNKTLLENSLRFVHQMVHLITGGLSKQLVDAKI